MKIKLPSISTTGSNLLNLTPYDLSTKSTVTKGHKNHTSHSVESTVIKLRNLNSKHQKTSDPITGMIILFKAINYLGNELHRFRNFKVNRYLRQFVTKNPSENVSPQKQSKKYKALKAKNFGVLNRQEDELVGWTVEDEPGYEMNDMLQGEIFHSSLQK